MRKDEPAGTFREMQAEPGMVVGAEEMRADMFKIRMLPDVFRGRTTQPNDERLRVVPCW